MPAASPSRTKPSSITSPPNTVTSSAWTAALRFSRASPLWPDEQERRDRRQLPEHVQGEQVVGEDEPEHHAGEGEQERGVAGGVRRARRRSSRCSRRGSARRSRRRARPSPARGRRAGSSGSSPSSGAQARAGDAAGQRRGRVRQRPHQRDGGQAPPRRRTRPGGCARTRAGAGRRGRGARRRVRAPAPSSSAGPARPPIHPAARRRFGLRCTPGSAPAGTPPGEAATGSHPIGAALRPPGRADAGSLCPNARCGREHAHWIFLERFRRSIRYTGCTTQNNDNRSTR